MQHRTSRIRFSLLIIVLFVITGAVLPLPMIRLNAQQAGFDEVNAQRATVSISQMTQTATGQPIISCVGSGTMVSADGLILTNAHIARGSSLCKTDSLVIGITARPGEPPIPTYYADVVQINTGWDLAVLQIMRALDGRAINRATLSLPFVELGDSGVLTLDDTIAVIGYPGSAEKTNGAVTIKRGTVTNFLDEARNGARAWIKTNAAIPARMSGGGAYSKDGKLIGVPTLERLPDQRGAECRLVQDTNADGRVDTSDTCVPSGGFVDVLRPVRLARGLVRAAQLGLSVSAVSKVVSPLKPGGPPMFSRPLVSTGVTAAGMPTSVVESAPNGTTALYLFFDYKNMVDESVYEMRLTIDGVPNTLFSLSPTLWSGGQQGMWYIGASSQVWPNGQYVFTLLINGQRATSHSVNVGGLAQNSARFSDILFGITGLRRAVIPSGTVLPGNSTINAEFIYSNVPEGATWRQVWYYESVAISQNLEPVSWGPGGSGKKLISAGANDQAALIAGRYRLELYLQEGQTERLAATSDFIMAGVNAGDRVSVFENPVFSLEKPVIGPTTEKELDGKSITVERVQNGNSAFPDTTPGLYVTFKWNNIAVGTPWSWRLTVDGNPLFESTQRWNGAPDSPFYTFRLGAADRLIDGAYTFEVYVEDLRMGTATAKIGIGQLPVETFLLSGGVQVQGRILDAETRKGIAGVMFIVIKGTVITREFTWDTSEVVETSITDSEGRFQLNRLLPRGQTYNILVVARSYLPLATDGLQLDEQTVNPLTINIELNKD